MGKKNKRDSEKSSKRNNQTSIKSHTERYKPGIRIFKPEILLIGIFIVALAIRLLYLYQVISTPLFHGLVADADKYDNFSLQILRGNLTDKDSIYLNPFYPFFLALIYRIFDHSHLAVVLIQAIIDSLSCIVLYLLASICFNKRVATIAAFIFACYGTVVFYTATLLAPTLVIFLALSFITTLLTAQKKQKSLIFLLSGLLFGLLVAARPNVLLFIPFLLLWFFGVLKNQLGGHKATQGFVFLLIGLSTVLSLITIRNYSITKRISPFSVQGGINFYIGNNPEAKGYFMSPHGISSSPIEQIRTSVNYAAKDSGNVLTPSQASRYWLLKGLEFIKDNPFDAFALYIKKFALFWRNEELPLNIDHTYSSELVPLFRLPFFSFGIIVPFALLGIMLSLKRKDASLLVIFFITAHMISVIIFFVTARYRAPAIPFLIIFSSYTFCYVVEKLQLKDLKAVTLSVIFLIVSFIGINKDFSLFTLATPPVHYSNLGMVYHRLGKLDESVSALKKALAIDPLCVEAHYNLGNVYTEKGLLDEAIEEYKKALHSNPDVSGVHNNLGMAYGKKGLFDEAIAHFNKALTTDENLEKVYYNRGIAYGKQGKLDESIADFKQALDLNPESAQAHFNLGITYSRKGMQDQAFSHFKQAIARDPNLAEVYKKIVPNTDVPMTQ